MTPKAGSFSPFVLKLNRNDGTQRIADLETALPRGITAKLAGVPYCPEAAIAAAKAREVPNQGAVEAANPSCPAASQVGTAVVGAGAGPTPLYVQGRAYLAGPYNGAPLSLVIITPGVAGPFDLGAVVVRTALLIDPETAQVRAVSDKLPTIIDGIPLDVRSIAVTLDRQDFTLNPTSCASAAVQGRTTSTTGAAAPLSTPFRAGGCKSLNFGPKLSLALKGPTKRTGHATLRAVLTQPKGQANIGRVSVVLPKSQFIDQDHINNTCTRPQFAEGNCPAKSILGRARAFTPLLDKPWKVPSTSAPMAGNGNFLM